MTTNRPALHPKFRVAIGIFLTALGLLGASSLATKELPLALFGRRATGNVTQVEVIQTSTKTKWEKKGFGPKKAVSRGSDITLIHLSFTAQDGKPVNIKTTATFHTEAKVGDTLPIIYMASHPENAKIYSAKQLWLPMTVGITFTTISLLLGLLFIRGW